MKRNPDREGSPRSKRPRSSYSDHDGGRDRGSPEPDRRESRSREPKQKPFRGDFDHDSDHHGRGKFRDDRMSDPGYAPPMPPRGSESRGGEYRSLCISNISNKVPDHAVRDMLYREFKKFGEYNVNIAYAGEQRVAYINFRYPEDARAAKHTKSKMVLFERPARTEAVYNKRRSNSPCEFRDFPPPGTGREGGGSPGRSPTFNFGGGGGPGQHHGMRGGRRAPPPPPMHPPPPGMRGGPQVDPGSDDGMHRDSGDFPPFSPTGEQRRAPNEKFPYHLHHIMPEDDDKATRTLFVGNLDYNITDMDLRRVFEKYGVVEDIDIKRPGKGLGNAYAFVKFINLDCAHRAKVDMSGNYIGRFQCKIGYGKVTPTTCLWVGGLGPWLNHQTLEREFDRFGAIHRIEWPHGKNYAYVLYESLDAAQAARQEMRGFPLGGTDQRLRVDFADISHIQVNQSPPRRPEDQFDDRDMPPGVRGGGGSFGGPPPGNKWRQNDDIPNDRERRHGDWPHPDNGGNFRNMDYMRDSNKGHGEDCDRMGGPNDRRGRPRSPDEFADRMRNRRSRSPDKMFTRDPGGRDRENGRHQPYPPDRDLVDGGNAPKGNYSADNRRTPQSSGEKDGFCMDNVDNLNDLAKCLPVAWNGGLILKSSAFAARMHVVSGDVTIVDTLMRDPTSTETPMLRIKQRLRLDQPKLEDVGRRVSSAGASGHCILLALPSVLQNYEDPTGTIQQRPLKNLVTYLRQKEAAGVISLPQYQTKEKDNVGVLHAFPPCQFAHDFLCKRSPKLTPKPNDPDFMVIVVVRGAA